MKYLNSKNKHYISTHLFYVYKFGCFSITSLTSAGSDAILLEMKNFRVSRRGVGKYGSSISLANAW